MKASNPGPRLPKSWRPKLTRLEDRATPAVVASPAEYPAPLFVGPDQFPSPDGTYLTPDQIRTGYGINAIPTFAGNKTPDGAGQTIAIVDYGNDPNIASDLAGFDAFFGTAGNEINARSVSSFFTQVGQTGGAPLTGVDQEDPEWIGETCLDVEWAHAIAPMANIVLVECDLNDPNGLFTGDVWAADQPGVSVISNSWGGSEFLSETSFDPDFVTPAGHQGVTFVFSAGDSGTISYPASSPNVLSVGGTNLTLGAGDTYLKETGWSYNTPFFGQGGGGGISQIEARPSFQAGESKVVGRFRGTPDVAYNGGGSSLVWTYDSFNNGSATPWDGVYGTSAGAPQWSGLLAIVNQGRATLGLGSLDGKTQTLKAVYSLPSADFHDIKGGQNAYGEAATTGYDLLTGLGTPVANKLVPDLIGESTTAVSAAPGFAPLGTNVTITATVSGATGTPTGTVDFKVGGVDLGKVTLSSGTAVLTTNALPDGTDTITATYSGDSNYPGSSATTTVMIGQATPTLSVSVVGGAEPTYGQSVTLVGTAGGFEGVIPTGTLDFKYGNIDLGTASLSGGTATLATSYAFPAGTDTITLTYSGDPSFVSTTGTATLTVAPAVLTVIPDAQTMTYGGALPALTFSVSGFVNGESPALLSGELETDAGPTAGVGSYPITQGSLTTQGGNYLVSITPAFVKVTPAPLTVTATPQTAVYGAADPDLSGAFTASGFVNGDTTAVMQGSPATDAVQGSPVGAYDVTEGSLSAGLNYAIQFVDGTLTVTPAPLAVTADAESVQYGALLPTLTYSFSGLVNGDTATVLSGVLATTATFRSGVGDYEIKQGTLTADANYAIQYSPGTLTITPAPLVVAAKNVVSPNDQLTPQLGYTVTGLVNADTPSVVTVSLATTATTTSPTGEYPITVTSASAANYSVTTTGATLTLTSSPSLVGSSQFAVASNGTGNGAVTLYNADGSVATTVTPFPGYTGPLRTAVADFNGDGTPDVIVGTGPGIAAEVKIYDGKTQNVIFDVNPFGTFTGGVYVAAGDISGDGTAELVVTPDQGGGPRVSIYHSGNINPVASFFGISDPSFRGGARVAVGDLNRDGHADLVVAAGFGGGSRVSVYDGAALSKGQLAHPVGDFFAFTDNLRNGTYVAIGDVNGDGYADLIIGGGPGAGPRVLVLSGQTLWSQGSVAALATPIANFFAGDTSNRDGVPVAAKNLDNSGQADVVVGVGGGGATVTIYSGSSLTSGNPAAIDDIDAFPGFADGVYVG